MAAALGIEISRRPVRDVVVESLAAARSRRSQIAEALEDAARLTREREVAAADKELNRQLTLVLRANKFREWLFDEVFAALVSGTNRLLADLTRGQYQLAMAGRDFEVIDHLSAGNRRSVKTLSGGETFLVSLALAIALAEEVATSAGAVGLESFFLDEGFGTLDGESLEVVAGVIAELGAQGKVVGIVTHVAELAEQMPVRYEIRKDAKGAAVDVTTR
jgi:exonuclease SbcC